MTYELRSKMNAEAYKLYEAAKILYPEVLVKADLLDRRTRVLAHNGILYIHNEREGKLYICKNFQTGIDKESVKSFLRMYAPKTYTVAVTQNLGSLLMMSDSSEIWIKDEKIIGNEFSVNALHEVLFA